MNQEVLYSNDVDARVAWARKLTTKVLTELVRDHRKGQRDQSTADAVYEYNYRLSMGRINRDDQLTPRCWTHQGDKKRPATCDNCNAAVKKRNSVS